jgi:hypothetical protein
MDKGGNRKEKQEEETGYEDILSSPVLLQFRFLVVSSVSHKPCLLKRQLETKNATPKWQHRVASRLVKLQ